MILAALERRWLQEPDLRLGQLLVNLTRDLGSAPSPLFGITDGELLRRIGVETGHERRYMEDEPSSAGEGWRAWLEEQRGGRSARPDRRGGPRNH